MDGDAANLIFLSEAFKLMQLKLGLKSASERLMAERLDPLAPPVQRYFSA
jgi:hypothetical protein